ncbi:MAG TPA: hypothetical protein VEJ63_18940, partial [Planctomycetota bacterium]|nr:hypothetical protein [Planctomycetota bacterium]
MSIPFLRRPLFTLALASLCWSAWAEDAPDALKPALEAEQAHDGLVTWWLVSAVQKTDLAAAKPPLNARESEDAAGAGKWRVHITAPDRMRYVDLKPFVNARSGVVWAAARVRSQKGGARKLRVGSFCALKVFLDGKLVLEKAQPQLRDEGEAEIELPKGDSELTVGVAVRSGFAAFQFNMTEGRAIGGMPRPVAGDRLLLPTKTGAEPDIGDAAVRGALFVSREMFIQPGQSVILALAMQGSLPVGVGPVEPVFKGSDGTQIGKPVPARPLADVAKSHWQVEYAVPKTVGFAHDVSVELKSGEKVLGTRKLTLFSLAGMRESLAALDAEIKKQAAATGKPLPSAMLAVEKLRLFMGKIEQGEEYM